MGSYRSTQETDNFLFEKANKFISNAKRQQPNIIKDDDYIW